MPYTLTDCDGNEFDLFTVRGLAEAERAAPGKPTVEAFLNTGMATAVEAKRMLREIGGEPELASLKAALCKARGGVMMTDGVTAQ